MADKRRALVLVAHGSRRESSNQEVRHIATQLAEQSAGKYEIVLAAFLEIAEPLIPAGIEQCLNAGMDEVVVLPYFLSAGRHVVEDVPAEVAKVNNINNATVRIAPYLGAAEGLADILLQQSEK